MSPLDHIRIFVVVLVRSSVLFPNCIACFSSLSPVSIVWFYSFHRRHHAGRPALAGDTDSNADADPGQLTMGITGDKWLWCHATKSHLGTVIHQEHHNPWPWQEVCGVRATPAVQWVQGCGWSLQSLGIYAIIFDYSPCPDLTEESWSAGRTETLEFIFKSQHLPSAMLGRISKCHFRLTRDLKHPLRPVFIEVTNTLTPYSIHRFMITPQFAQYKRTCGTMERWGSKEAALLLNKLY